MPRVSSSDEPTTPSRRTSTRAASNSASSTPSRARKSTTEPTIERPVTRSSSRAAARDSSPEPTPKKAPARAKATKTTSASPARKRAATPTRKTAAKQAKESPSPPPTPPRRRSTSRGRRAVEDQEEEQSDDTPIVTKTKTKPSPRRGRSRAVHDADEDEDEEEKPTPKKVTKSKKVEKAEPVVEVKRATTPRRRSRSRGRDATAVDLLADAPSTRRVASPGRHAAASIRSPLDQGSPSPSDEEDDEEFEHIHTPRTTRRRGSSLTRDELRSDYRRYSTQRAQLEMVTSRQPAITYTAKDIVFITLSFLTTLIAVFATVWFANPDFRVAIETLCPEFASVVTKYKPSFLEVTLFNVVVYFISLFILSYKLRRHDKFSFRVTSVLFHGFGSLNALLAYLSFLPFNHSSSNYILHAISPLLLAFSVVELVYSVTFASIPRFIELFTTIGVSLYVLFLADQTNPIVAAFPRFLVPVLVVYLASNAILSFGYVGVLCAPIDSELIASLSHSSIWIHILLTIVGPCFIFYIEVVADIDTISSDKVLITASGLSSLLSLVLAFASYADSMKVSYLIHDSDEKPVD